VCFAQTTRDKCVKKRSLFLEKRAPNTEEVTLKVKLPQKYRTVPTTTNFIESAFSIATANPLYLVVVKIIEFLCRFKALFDLPIQAPVLYEPRQSTKFSKNLFKPTLPKI
jgi:hypothetical protein